MKKVLTLFFATVLLLSAVLPFCAATGGRDTLGALLSENCDASQYTADSYLEYQKAVTLALSVYHNEFATEDEIESAISSLQENKSRLVFRSKRDELSRYVEDIDRILDNLTKVTPEDVRQQLLQEKSALQALIGKPDLTDAEATPAIEHCKILLESALSKQTDTQQYSDYGSNEGIVVPTDYVAPTNEIGGVTRIRLILFFVGIGLTVIGIVTVVVYFVKSKKQ